MPLFGCEDCKCPQILQHVPISIANFNSKSKHCSHTSSVKLHMYLPHFLEILTWASRPWCYSPSRDVSLFILSCLPMERQSVCLSRCIVWLLSYAKIFTFLTCPGNFFFCTTALGDLVSLHSGTIMLHGP